MGMNLINKTSVEPGAGSKPGTTPSAKTTGSVNISIKWAD